MTRLILAVCLAGLLTAGWALGAPQDATTLAENPSGLESLGAAVPPPPQSATSAPAQSPPSDAGEGEESGAKAPTRSWTEDVLAAMQPPDGQWLVDGEGRSYFIEKRLKSLPYQRMSGSRIGVPYGGVYDLAGEDDESLWLKVYRLPDNPTPHLPTVPRPTAEALAASASTFPGPLSSSDRVHLNAFDSGLPREGSWRNGFDLADINGDGEVDFVHGPTRRGGDQPRAFLGDGHGKWRPYKVSVPPGLLDYGDVKVADFNGDGKADLAAAVHLRGVAVFVGDGAGKFTSWGEGLDFVVPHSGYDGSGFSSRRLEVLDWNRDGKPDLLALSEGPQTVNMEPGRNLPNPAVVPGRGTFGPRVYLNKGSGSWVAVEGFGSAREISGDDLVVANFGEKKGLGFVIATNVMGRSDLLYLRGKTAEEPLAPIDLPLRPRCYVKAVAAGDFDGDGRSDIALTYVSFELGVARVGVDLFLARKGGEWERRPVFAREGRVALSALAAGDLDGDRRLDLVATDYDGHLALFLGTGDGGFTSEDSPEAQQPRGLCRGYGLKALDLDRDGRAEIVATYAGESHPLYDPLRCLKGGGVAAWSVESAK